MAPKDPRKPGALPPGLHAVGVISGIDRRADKLLSDAGWKGGDARAFEAAWGEDSEEARRLSALESAAGQVVDDLAVALADVQIRLNDRLKDLDLNGQKKDWLENAKDQSEKLQKAAAEKLIKLYSPGKGWTLLGALNKHDSDKKLPEKFRDKMEDVKDDLQGEVPDDLWNHDAALDWAATGTVIGGTVGAVVGGIVGAGGGALFGGVGAVPGAIIGAGSVGAVVGIAGGVVGFVAGGLFG